MSVSELEKAFEDFDKIFSTRIEEANAFYAESKPICPPKSYYPFNAGVCRNDLVQAVGIIIMCKNGLPEIPLIHRRRPKKKRQES